MEPMVTAQREAGIELATAIIETTPQPFLVLNEGLEVLVANSAFYDLFQVGQDETLGHSLDAIGNRQWGIPELMQLLGGTLRDRAVIRDYRVEHDFPAIGRRTMLVNAMRLTSNGPPKVLLAINDVTEFERATYELAGQKEFAEKLIDSIREGLVVLDWDLRVKQANQPFYDMFKVSREETEGRLIYELGNRQWDIPALRLLLEKILPKEETFDDYQIDHDFESIGPRTMVLNARRLDHLNLILLAIEDVTARYASHRRQQLLARELSHRVKNILTMVDSVAAQTAREAEDLEGFQKTFHGRIKAIARSHGQWLADEVFKGSSLAELIRESLDGCAVDCDRYILDGPDVPLDPEQTLPLNLTIHELCTNSMKHGALAAPEGKLSVRWTIAEGNPRKVRLTWQEAGVPEIRIPDRKGFGLQLIEQYCPYELGGKVELDFAAGGLRCELTFPAAMPRDGTIVATFR
jgi:two-component sensor histidine kinase